jgi:hypothetical protein
VAPLGGVTDATRDDVLRDFYSRTTAVGVANNLYNCNVSASCQDQCQ